MTPQSAWAIVMGGSIMVKTIYDSRLGAIRNWLCTECGVMLNATSTDADAELLWDTFSKAAHVEVRPISIEVQP